MPHIHLNFSELSPRTLEDIKHHIINHLEIEMINQNKLTIKNKKIIEELLEQKKKRY